jgi:hypothetical protein
MPAGAYLKHTSEKGCGAMIFQPGAAAAHRANACASRKGSLIRAEGLTRLYSMHYKRRAVVGTLRSLVVAHSVRQLSVIQFARLRMFSTEERPE